MRGALGFGAAGYLVLLVGLWLGVSRWSALSPVPAGLAGSAAAEWPGPGSQRVLDEPGAHAVLAALRARLAGGASASLPLPAFRAQAALWCAGRAVATSAVAAQGAVLEAPGFEPSRRPAGDLPAADELRRCRLRLDVDRGRAPVLTTVEPLFALGLLPGLDGLALRYGDREVFLGPDELLAADLLAGHRPLADVDLELGLEVRGVLRHLAMAVGADAAAWRRTARRLERVRVESWVESAATAEAAAGARAVPLLRGLPPAPAPSAEALRQAGRQAARYLERHLRQGGRFDYLYDPIADQVIADADDYSLPRHAGAAWFLSQAASALDQPALSRAARRALEYLIDQAPAACDRPAFACVGAAGDRRVDLGSSALALLAALEYRRASGDARFAPWSHRLGAFLLAMQRPAGDFRHLFDLDSGIADESSVLLYYSGEAAFALSRLAADPDLRGPERAVLVDRVDAALDWLTGANYRHFASGFFYGEDHWTCIAIGDAWELLAGSPRRERYGDFCEGFVAFLDRSRFRAGDGALGLQPDLRGAYGFTPMMPPHATPAASRTEAVLSAHRVATLRGHRQAAARMEEAIRDSLGYLLSRQYGAAGSWMMPDPAAAEGGLPMSDLQRAVRIDHLQHAGSAMLRAASLPSLSSLWRAAAAAQDAPGPDGGARRSD